MKPLSELSDAELASHYQLQQETTLKNIDELMKEAEAGRIPLGDIDKEMHRLMSGLDEMNLQFRVESERRNRNRQLQLRLVAGVGFFLVALFLFLKLR